MLCNDVFGNIDFVGFEGPRCPINSTSMVKLFGHRGGVLFPLFTWEGDVVDIEVLGRITFGN